MGEPVRMCPTVEELPDGWQVKRLSSFCTKIGTGATPRGGSEVYLNSRVKYALIRSQHVFDRHFDTVDLAFISDNHAKELRNAEVQSGDVLLNITGDGVTFGRSCIVPDRILPACVNQHVSIIRPDRRECDPGYLLSVLTYPATKGYIESFNSGGSRRAITKGHIESFEIPLPPLPSQKAIAAVLGALDDKIELSRRMNVTLEAMVRALFQSWFMDFDPVRAKLDGRQPSDLDPATAALFPEHFEHSEDGLLPVGWRHVVIEDFCAINAWTLSKGDSLETLEYVEISEVTRGDIANIATYARGEEPSRARRRLRHGDTVLSTVRPDRGSYFLALNPPANRIVSTGFAVVSPSKVPWSFLHAALIQPEVSDHLGQMADGGAYPAVRPEIIGAIKIAMPNDQKILEAFHRVCGSLLEQAEANRSHSRTLATLRDTLLPKLLSGEIQLNRINEAEIESSTLEFPVSEEAGTRRKASDEFVEAIIVSQLVRKLATPDYPLGRKRYNKLAYLAHRKAEDDVAKRYLKKAAGPYSPWAKYGGPEKIAVRNGYVAKASCGKFEGLVAGEQIDKIDLYLPKYPVCAALDWVISEFRYRKNDELELLATVDFAVFDLMNAGQAVTSEAVKELIANNEEWAPKLKREIFSDGSIVRALEELREHFPTIYAGHS